MNINKKSGFTLLEIIIVIIIVGVLASLALPRFFSTVEFSRATEALNSMGVIRSSIVRCSLITDDVKNCKTPAGTGALTFATLDVDDPGLEPGAHFAYAMNINAGTNDYTITATRNTRDGGVATSTIVMTVVAGVVSRSGTGAFDSIK